MGDIANQRMLRVNSVDRTSGTNTDFTVDLTGIRDLARVNRVTLKSASFYFDHPNVGDGTNVVWIGRPGDILVPLADVDDPDWNVFYVARFLPPPITSLTGMSISHVFEVNGNRRAYTFYDFAKDWLVFAGPTGPFSDTGGLATTFSYNDLTHTLAITVVGLNREINIYQGPTPNKGIGYVFGLPNGGFQNLTSGVTYGPLVIPPVRGITYPPLKWTCPIGQYNITQFAAALTASTPLPGTVITVDPTLTRLISTNALLAYPVAYYGSAYGTTMWKQLGIPKNAVYVEVFSPASLAFSLFWIHINTFSRGYSFLSGLNAGGTQGQRVSSVGYFMPGVYNSWILRDFIEQTNSNTFPYGDRPLDLTSIRCVIRDSYGNVVTSSEPVELIFGLTLK